MSMNRPMQARSCAPCVITPHTAPPFADPPGDTQTRFPVGRKVRGGGGRSVTQVPGAHAC